MADDNRKQDAFSEITSLSDEESITEIDLGSFLSDADKESKAVLYEGYHEDIKNTEKSLDDELKNLYDNIMSTGPATIVPKTMDDITAPEQPESPLADGWMSPEEYLEIPSVPADKEKVEEAVAEGSEKTDSAKDNIFSMIDDLKTQTRNEKGFDDIINEIELNKAIDVIDTDLANTQELTKDYVPEVPAEPAAPAKAPVTYQGYDLDSPEFADELAVLLGDKPAAPAAEPEPVPAAPAEPVYTAPSEPAQPVYTAPEAPVRDIPVYTAPVQPAYEAPIPTYNMSEDEADAIPISRRKPNFNADAADEEIPAAPVPYDSLISSERTVGVVPDVIYEDDGKISRKEKKQAKKEKKEASGKKPSKASEVIRKIVLTISIITIICAGAYLIWYYVYEPQKYKSNEAEVADMLQTDVSGTVDDNSKAGDGYPKGMLAKYTQLYDINKDIMGWITIDKFDINLPIVQGENNDYYLHRNIYNKWTNYGVPFFDYRIDFGTSGYSSDLPMNTVVYGHSMHYDNYIFGNLENYRDIDDYKSAPVIECNTIYGDFKWKVYAVFETNSVASGDNGYLFPYTFINISTENFAQYKNELDQRSFYVNNAVDLLPTDKILTLSTCAYDFDGARLVVVARLVREGESESVDTSKVTKNQNPRYPQAWYDAQKKVNPYASASNWNPYA